MFRIGIKTQSTNNKDQQCPKKHRLNTKRQIGENIQTAIESWVIPIKQMQFLIFGGGRKQRELTKIWNFL